MENPYNYRNVKGNEILFTYPNENLDAGFCNQRCIRIEPNTNAQTKFEAEIKFESSLLQKVGLDGVMLFDILSEEAMEQCKNLVLPTKHMLIELIQKLGCNWASFLSNYLHFNVRYFRSFISKDIAATLRHDLFFSSPQIRLDLDRILQNRNMLDVTADYKDLVQTMLKNYQTSDDLIRAKSEIISILEEAGVLMPNQCPKELRPDSREILASNMIYIPMIDLKKAILAGAQDRLFTVSPGIEKFIWDGIVRVGDHLYENDNSDEDSP